jgi:hypothetical protein
MKDQSILLSMTFRGGEGEFLIQFKNKNVAWHYLCIATVYFHEEDF